MLNTARVPDVLPFPIGQWPFQVPKLEVHPYNSYGQKIWYKRTSILGSWATLVAPSKKHPGPSPQGDRRSRPRAVHTGSRAGLLRRLSPLPG